MEYINTDLKNLKDLLKESVVVFEYKKKDGSIRKSRGTWNKEIVEKLLPPKEPEIKLEKKVVDLIIKEHDYKDISEYSFENNVVFEYEDEDYYYFNPKKRTRVSPEGQTIYFDLDKMSTRSFINDNYLGVIEIEK